MSEASQLKILNEARGLRATYSATAKALQANDRLSTEGRSAEMTDLRSSFVPSIKELRAKFWADVEADQQRLERDLCSPANVPTAERVAQAASFRDARDRVRNLKAAELRVIYGEAQRSSDDLLARACLVRAISLQVPAIVEDWAQRHPSDGRVLAELNELDRMRRDHIKIDMTFSGAG